MVGCRCGTLAQVRHGARGSSDAPSLVASPGVSPPCQYDDGGRRRGVGRDSGGPPVLTWAIGIMGLVMAVLAGAAMSFATQVPTPVPTSAQAPGSCHLAEDPNELIAIPSD